MATLRASLVMSISEPVIPPRSAVAGGSPRWLPSGLFALLASACVCWPCWPGLISYDGLFAYREAQTGIETMLWPPMHAYLFFLSRLVGAQAWGLFLAQTFLLFFSAAIIVNLLARRSLHAAVGLLVVAVGFLFAPELLGVVMVQWRDVTATSFALAGVAGYLLAARYRSPAGLALTVLCLSVAAALRYNSVLLIVFVLPLVIWAPYLGGAIARQARARTAATLMLGLGLAWASTQWRLPDLKRLPDPHNFAGIQEFDLLGISACADKVYLPAGVTGGEPITPRQIRVAYDPRHLQAAFRPIKGAPRIVETDVQGEVERVWPAAVRAEPGCYLAHRIAVFVEQMGMARGGVFYPTHGVIDANPYGFQLAHPKAMAAVNGYIVSRAPELWRRPFILYGLAVIAAAVLWARRNRGRLLVLALVGGSLAYPAALFVAGPAADARYIFPSSVFCVLVLASSLALLLDETPTTDGRAGRLVAGVRKWLDQQST